ncbi:MAG: HD domain-containing protein [Pyrinomonadaceae bacterium]|nr:HD domain-containing protein [Sphingobacteriaceae bacterium]
MSVIDQTIDFVKKTLKGAEGGHDWWHIYRVWQTSITIAKQEPVNMLVVELAALLHDIADSKFNNGDEEIGPLTAANFLRSIGVDENSIDEVGQIIRHISFKAGFEKLSYQSKELEVVQDADRLDAIGAIGIARAFSYGGFMQREFYDPGIPPNLKMSKEEYKNSKAPTINHFYEKLLLLKDKMNTRTGKRLAVERHEFMEKYLEQFYGEWSGKK